MAGIAGEIRSASGRVILSFCLLTKVPGHNTYLPGRTHTCVLKQAGRGNISGCYGPTTSTAS